MEVSAHLFVLQVTSHHPSVGHIWESLSTSQLTSESFGQQLHYFSALFHIGSIVTGRKEKGGASHFFSQFHFASTVDHLFESN